MTNPAEPSCLPFFARTVTGCRRSPGGRVVLGMGAGGMWRNRRPRRPRLSPAARIRALEEAIVVVRALSGGGDPVTFDRRVYHVTELTPAAAPTPPIWIGFARLRKRCSKPADTPTDGYQDTSPTGAARRLPSHGPSSTKRLLQ